VNERGAISVLGVAVVAVTLVGALVGFEVSRLVLARVQAQTAADAAALAAAPVTFAPFGAGGTPAEEAERFAMVNGATLESCLCPPDPVWRARTVVVEVVVPVDGSFIVTGVHARSAARFDPTVWLTGNR